MREVACQQKYEYIDNMGSQQVWRHLVTPWGETVGSIHVANVPFGRGKEATEILTALTAGITVNHSI